MSKKILLLNLVFISILILSSFSEIGVIEHYKVNSLKSFDIFNQETKNNGINSNFIYGKEIGRRFYVIYHLLNFLFLTNAKNFNKLKIFEQIKNQKNMFFKYCPDYFEELSGLAASTKIRVERLMAIQLFFSSFTSQCTITASCSPATKKNQTYITQNLDAYSIFSPELYIFRIFFTRYYNVYDVNPNYKYVYLGLPIIYEYPLLNEKGLGFAGTGTTLTDNKSRYIDEGDGIPPYVLVRKTMRTCSNVTEVASLWTNSTRSSHKKRILPQDWDYDNYAFCDRENRILMIEQTHNYIITVFGESSGITNASKGILWHSNHHQWLNPELTGSIYPENSPSSLLRAERAKELLEINYGNITIETCKKITRDHEGGTDKNGKDSSDICRHPDKNESFLTMFAWIVQPKNFTVYWTRSSPCKTDFIAYNFSNIFN